jgi:hypothetical protein
MTTLDESVTTEVSLTDATDLFLNRWADADDRPSDTDKGEPSPTKKKDEDEATVPAKGEEQNTDDEDLNLEDDESDDTAQTDGDDDNSDDKDAPEATDDHKVLVTVDGETKSVTVKELKRLYGQEASLTRKSQEVAQARKDADTSGERFAIATQRLLDKATERFKPFEGIDWMVAQQRLTPEEFGALREEARESFTQVQFLQSEADEVLKAVKEQAQGDFVKRAREAVEVLERDIPGWDKNVYQSVCEHAVSEGMDAEVVFGLTDPSAIKMLHNSMRYAALKAKAAQKKSQPTANAPKRVVKPSTSKSSVLGSDQKSTDGLKKLSQSGSRDDAVAAFMDGWADSDS